MEKGLRADMRAVLDDKDRIMAYSTRESLLRGDWTLIKHEKTHINTGEDRLVLVLSKKSPTWRKDFGQL